MILIQKIKKIKVKPWLKEVALDILFFTIVMTFLLIYLTIIIKRNSENVLILTNNERIQTQNDKNSSTTLQFVASSKGKYYYKVGSERANSLSEKNKVYFKTAEDAEKLGFKPYFND
jgi:hypothetical protein